MNTLCLRNQTRRHGSSVRLPSRSLVLLCLLFAFTNTSAAAAEQLFEPPPAKRAHDDVWLISTRKIGTRCSHDAMQKGLDCQMLSVATGKPSSTAGDWRELTSEAVRRPTIIYIHGNRVATGQDRAEGLLVYRSFQKHRTTSDPVRFIIWSWPAEQIRGQIKDYVVKARRTNPAAWQLAWLLDKLPAETAIHMVGYSYGTRVACGATHLLAGGSLGQLKLDQRVHPKRPAARAALMAAAFDADWLQPGQFYSRSMSQFERVILATNKLDPAMRFYHFSNGIGHMDALGKFGLHNPRSLGSAARRVQSIDYTHAVGRSHMVNDYFAAYKQMDSLWRVLMADRSNRLAKNTRHSQTGAFAAN